MSLGDDIVILETTSTEVKNRILKPHELLRAIDTGALYIGGKDGKPQALVASSTTSDGGIAEYAGSQKIVRVKPPGGGSIMLEDFLPDIHPIIDGDALQLAGQAPVTVGPVTLSVGAASAGQPHAYSIYITATGAGSFATAITVPTPTEAGYSTQLATAYGEIRHNVRISDWQQVSKLYVSLIPTGGNASNCYRGVIVDSTGKAELGQRDPNMSSAWNGVMRPVSIESRHYVTIGTPVLPWKYDTESMTVSQVYFDVTFTGAATIEINIDSPRWPVAQFVLSMDGMFPETLDYILPLIQSTGIRLSGSWGQMSPGSTTTQADIARAVAAGVYTYPHIHKSSGASVANLDASTTPAQIIAYANQYWRGGLQGGSGRRNKNFASFMGNVGRSSADCGATMRQAGFGTTRADCYDAEFGIDPWSSTIPSAVATYTRHGCGVPQRGCMNWSMMGVHDGLAVGALDTFSGSNLEADIKYAVLTRKVLFAYMHRIMGVPTATNIGKNFVSAMLGTIADSCKSGSAVTEYAYEPAENTYYRKDDFYTDKYGNWRRRSNPSVIAL